MAVDTKFHGEPVSCTLAQLAACAGAAVPDGQGDVVINGVSASADATASSLTFFCPNKDKPGGVAVPTAGACFVTEKLAHLLPEGVIRLIVDNPKMAFIKASAMMHPPEAVKPGTASTAVVDPTAEIDETAQIDDYAVIKAGAKIGPGVHIGAHTVIGEHVEIGAGSSVGHHASVEYATLGKQVHIAPHCAIGGESFAYEADMKKGEVLEFPQLGRVVIHDHVDVHARSHIERGALSDTVLNKYCKIGSGCLISHGCTLGMGAAIFPDVSLMGSVSVGQLSKVHAGSKVRDQVRIGAQATVAMGSTVVSNVADGATVMGNPAKEAPKERMFPSRR